MLAHGEGYQREGSLRAAGHDAKAADAAPPGL
ncbi:protein of unknown function [Paraburkholderia dioscoreae]|uniref:Uncharacterized protein n=1 Tax=Paraburkholderia dioscoreae TaxID=2604047 RepID=A0A5Q4ZVC7_9BURK|nr:protein of unknown function [Paraburkholderia dioscoreae]